MKNLSKQIYPLLFFLLLAAGCIREDLSECPPSVTRLSFAHTTPCSQALAYPQDVDSLRLFVFNEDGVFTAQHILSPVRLAADYSCDIPLPGGIHRIITWAGTGSLCQTIPATFEVGKTPFAEAALALRKGYCNYTGAADSVLACTGSLYFAEETVEAGTSRLVTLTKNTTGIRVSVSGLNTQDTYRLVITGDDNRYQFDNTFTSSGKLNYIMPLIPDVEGNAGAAIDMLNPGKGSHPDIVILDTATGNEVFREDLVKLITDRMPEVSFDCVLEFDIDITFKTDLSVSVSVNGWNITEEEGDLG